MAVGAAVLSPESTLEKIHPTGELRKALATYFAMSLSTSGVEQKFSRAQMKFHSRIAATAQLEDMALKVMQDASEYNDDMDRQRLIRIARKVWLCCFQKSRQRVHRRRRIDFGVKRAILKRRSEKAFVRKRRAAASAAAAVSAAGAAASAAAAVSAAGVAASAAAAGSAAGAAAPAVAAASAAGPRGRRLAGWSESHTKELQFQIEKRRQRKMELVAEGDAGSTTAERAEILEQARKRVSDQRGRERKAKRSNIQVNGISIAQCLQWHCKGKSAWTAPECRSEELAKSLARLGMTRLRRLVGARVMVVPCPSEAMKSNCYRAPAALLGCCLASPSLFKSDSDLGRAIVLRSAMAKRWDIWISPSCAAKHVEWWAFVKECMEVTKCHWKLHFGSEVDDDWTPLKAKFKKTPARLLACVGNAEIGDGKFAGWKTTMTMAAFTEKIVDVESTIHGF